MTLTSDEIRVVLGYAMAYDNRKMPGEANLAAWAEAARRGRWTLDAAVEAVHTHYAAGTDFLMPGHITQLLRLDQRQPPPFVNPTRTALPAGLADTTRAIPPDVERKPFLPWPSRKARRRQLTDEGRAQARAELAKRRPPAEPDAEPAS